MEGILGGWVKVGSDVSAWTLRIRTGVRRIDSVVVHGLGKRLNGVWA